MKSFEEYFNLDGKDALESPIINASFAANPEERYLSAYYDNETVVNNNANVNLNNSTLSPWNGLNPCEAAVKDANAMVCSPQIQAIDIQTWLADFVYPTDTVAPSPALPMSAQTFATPCETPALLDPGFLDTTTSPEFNNSPMFAPTSTTTSPAWKTSPPFGVTSYSPGLDDPIVALGLGLQDPTVSLFPVAQTSTSSSSVESTNVPNLEDLLRSFTSSGTEAEPSVSVPMSVLRAMVEHMSKCTCGQSAHSTPSVSATATACSSSVAPTVPMVVEAVDPFASRRRRVPNKLYLCSHTGCGKTFTRRFNLQTHEATHNPNRARDHVCEMCGKKFTRSHDLTRHMTVHAEEKHECEGCGKGYSRSDALRRHAEKCEGFTGVQKKMLPTLITLK